MQRPVEAIGRADAGTADVLLPMLAQSPVPAMLIEEDGRVLFFNAAAEALWGHARGEVMGRSIWPLLPAALRGGLAASGPQRQDIELQVRHKDGRPVWTRLQVSRGEIGGRTHYLALLRDITASVALRRHNRLLQMAIDQSNRPIHVLDAQRRIVYVNRAFIELFGYPAAELLGRDPVVMFPDRGLSADERARNHSLPWGRERLQSEALLRCKDGRERWVRIASAPFEGKEGDELSGYSVDVLYDVTEERQIRDLERDMLEALASSLDFEALGDYLCRRIEAIVPGVHASICRVAEGRLWPWAAPSLPPGYGPSFNGKAIGEGVASCGTAAHRGETVMVHDIGTDPLWERLRHVVPLPELRPCACWSYPVKRRDGNVAATFAFYFEAGGEPDMRLARIAETSVQLCVLAIEREEIHQRVIQLAQFDPLTGLPNRSHLVRRLEPLLAAAGPDGVAVLCMDVDRLRDVNDVLGHAAGDQLLVEVAERLRDLLPAGELLCRAEGNLFFAVVPDCDTRRAARLAGQVLAAVGEPIEVGGHRLQLGASVGISRFPDNGGGERETLLAQATAAMRQAEESGGGYRFFNPEMNQMAHQRLLLGAALQRTLAEGGLWLAYQPQVRAGDGALHGVEALARWDDPVFGAVPPERFIGLAEDTGQIQALGLWALREACGQLAAWRAAGARVPAVSVNLSPSSFGDGALPDFVAGLLREHRLPGASLTLEITESAAMNLTPDMLGVVQRLRALGVGLSVDDFGTGYSSLSSLASLPLSEIKIDRSFICQSQHEPRLRALAEAVVGIGRSLSLAVVAEGVETAAQRDWLRQLGCPVLQGYLFSRPLRPQDVPAWLAAPRPAADGDRSGRSPAPAPGFEAG